MLLLIFIYYYKGILTISDIQSLLNPLTERFFQKEEFDLGDIYTEVFGLEKEQVDFVKEDVIRKFEASKKTFEEAPEDSQELLQMFSFICMLSFDVYVKKLLIEKMIDNFGTKESKEAEKKKEKKDKT